MLLITENQYYGSVRTHHHKKYYKKKLEDIAAKHLIKVNTAQSSLFITNHCAQKYSPP